MNLLDFLSNTTVSVLCTRVSKSSVMAEDKGRNLSERNNFKESREENRYSELKRKWPGDRCLHHTKCKSTGAETLP